MIINVKEVLHQLHFNICNKQEYQPNNVILIMLKIILDLVGNAKHPELNTLPINELLIQSDIIILLKQSKLN